MLNSFYNKAFFFLVRKKNPWEKERTGGVIFA